MALLFMHRDSWDLHTGVGINFATTFWSFCILRLIVSVGVGGVPTFIFPMLMEFLPTKNRGKIASLVKVVQMTGSCTAVGIAWWLIPT